MVQEIDVAVDGVPHETNKDPAVVDVTDVEMAFTSQKSSSSDQQETVEKKNEILLSNSEKENAVIDDQ